MTPEQRAQRKADREALEQQRIRQAARDQVQRDLAERGHMPERLLQIVRPAYVEGARRAHRSKQKPA